MHYRWIRLAGWGWDGLRSAGGLLEWRPIPPPTRLLFPRGVAGPGDLSSLLVRLLHFSSSLLVKTATGAGAGGAKVPAGRSVRVRQGTGLRTRTKRRRGNEGPWRTKGAG